ncbi:hypothetical protein BH11CYA1_BH11CYA1_07080 [soil metagenome]
MTNRQFPQSYAGRSPAQLLKDARERLAIGIAIEAAEMANAATVTMKNLSFAPNNPQLADAYALVAASCTYVRTNFHGEELKREYLQRSLAAYKAEIACRELGCETEALAKAHFLYGRTLAADLGDSRGYQEIAKAMQILGTIAQRDEVVSKTSWLY